MSGCAYCFPQLLRECYFHPSRDTRFPCPRMKFMAYTAMLLLWCKPVILLLGKAYGREQIQRIVLCQMTPAHLDAAINFFVHSKELTTADHLAELIFAWVVHGDTLTNIQFERDFGGAA